MGPSARDHLGGRLSPLIPTELRPTQPGVHNKCDLGSEGERFCEWE